MPKSVIESLRAALIESDKPAAVVALDTGVPYNVVLRLLEGRDVRIDHADAIAESVGLELLISDK